MIQRFFYYIKNIIRYIKDGGGVYVNVALMQPNEYFVNKKF